MPLCMAHNHVHMGRLHLALWVLNLKQDLKMEDGREIYWGIHFHKEPRKGMGIDKG